MTPDENQGPIEPFSVPKLSDSAEEKADWVELYALKDDDGNASFSDLLTALGISGTADAAEEDDDDAEDLPDEMSDDDRYEGAGEDAFLEITDRLESCGRTSAGYPFEVAGSAVVCRDTTLTSVYVFLLLLSRYGHKAGGADGAKIFEEVCAKAAESYLGALETHVRSYVFGFPRRIGPRGFAKALDALCAELGEGCRRSGSATSPDQKDAKLDIVAWRSFADRRQGKLIAFGQCATGADWKDKATELIPPESWCKLWMLDQPAVWPIRMFFVPHRINGNMWFETCVKGGILFDRCRIVQHSGLLSKDLQDRIAAWSKAAIAKNQR